MTKGLKLLAETSDGLTVISAALQDAIIQIGDIGFDKSAQTLTLRANRFMHENKNAKRVQTGVQFNNVMSLSTKNIDRIDPQAYIVLLSIGHIDAGKNKNQDIHLIFAGGGEMRLQVEYIEVRLVDYLDERDTNKRPLHPDLNI